MMQCRYKFKQTVVSRAIAVVMLMLSFAGAAYAVAPAGETIGNKASAEYIDANGVTRTVTSNRVETTITQIGGVQLEADETKFIPSGELVYLPLTLLNTGNGDDVYNLSVANNAGFACESGSIVFFEDNGGVPGAPFSPVNTVTPSVGAGDELQFFVSCESPLGLAPDDQTVLTVSAASAFDSARVDAVDKTLIVSDVTFDVVKTMDPARGPVGETITVELRYRNTGNTAKDLTITDDLPPELEYQAGTAVWTFNSASAEVGLQDAATSGPQPLDGLNIDYQADAAGAPEVSFTIFDLPPGNDFAGVVRFEVVVASDALPGPIENIAEYYSDIAQTNVTAPASYVVEEEYAVTLTDPATIAASVDPNDDGTLVGADQRDDDSAANDVVSINAADQDGVVLFSNILRNDGNIEDRYQIVVDEAGSNFPLGTQFFLQDAEGGQLSGDSSAANSGVTPLLAAGEQYIVVLRAELPAAAAVSGPYTVRKTAVSLTSSAATDSVTDQLGEIVAASVDLTNNAPVDEPGVLGQGAGPEPTPVLTEPGALGETTTFLLYVNNTSALATGSYALSAGSAVDAAGEITAPLPLGWSVVFRESDSLDPTPVGSTQQVTAVNGVSPNSARLVYAEVTVPADPDGGNQIAAGNYPIYFRVESEFLGVADVKYDEVVVADEASFTLENQELLTVRPGECAVALHQVTNTGNTVLADGASRLFSFDAVDTNAADYLASEVYWDAVNSSVFDQPGDVLVALAPDNSFDFGGAGLAPGETQEFWVRVCADANAPEGATNEVSFVISLSVDGAEVQAETVIDEVVVVDAILSSLKEQAVDPECNGVAPADFSDAQVQALPGECVCYRITATNDDPVNTASNIRITDPVPFGTNYSACTATPDCVDGVTSSPAIGGRGDVIAEFGSVVLQPNASVSMQFCVEIDDVE